MPTEMERNLNMNATTSAGIQPLYRPVLNRHLLMTAKPNFVHHQFGQKAPLPKGKGKIVAWDKMSPLPKATTPLTEGVTPKGTAINMSRIVATPEQYGAYVSTTDQFDFFTPNPSPKVLDINEQLGINAGETLDALTASVLSSGTNVQYPNGKTARAQLGTSDVMTVDLVREAVRTLKGNKAQKINGDYVCIIHTDVAHDLMSDPKWRYPHEYSDPKNLYNGEIGKLYGVRFVESADAVMFNGESFAGKYDELSVVKVDGDKIYIYEELSETEATAMAGRKIIINGMIYSVSSATAGKMGGDSYNNCACLTCSENVDVSLDDDKDNKSEENASETGNATGQETEPFEILAAVDMKIYPGEGAANGKPVYSTLVLGANAYGVTDPKSTLESITKALGSGGTSDPLNQRSSMGWKAYHLAKILVDMYMVRIETISTRY